MYAPDEGNLLPKYRDCTTSNDFEIYLMCCGVMLVLPIYIYVVIFYICPSFFNQIVIKFEFCNQIVKFNNVD